MGGSDDRSLVSCHGTLGLWIGSLALLLFLGLDLVTGGRTQLPVKPAESWIGTDLRDLLGPLITIEGDSMDTDASGLRLWVLIADRECLSCLDELPVLHSLAGESGHRGVLSTAVALGDLHEARRTMLGIDSGMPVLVSTQISAPEVLELFTAERTPLRVLTWYGRIVDESDLSVLEKPGESRLVGMLQRWADW
ncbi:hypothetical protein ACFL6T_04655 [Candidatus Zixiibacteriota bacterium]